MATLICGSIAYDSIMTFEGRFREHILPDQVHLINLSFLVPTMRREFGGCAGNIAYALHLLGGDARIMGTIGALDAQPYLDRLEQLGLRRDHVRVLPETYTAQAMITTDLDNNQITAFHPGAMMQSHLNHAGDAPGIKLAIVGPDGFDGMVQHVEELARAGVPFVFDPGQGLPLFDGATLRRSIELATFVAVNDYEAKLVSDKTGWSEDEIASRVDALVITRGEHGATIRHKQGTEQIPVVPAERISDPTGCGDAFRGGLLYGIEHGLDWATTGRLASLMGSIKIAHQGPQTYALTRAEIDARFETAFGYSLK
ncbi:MAG: carbohydrate kinase family protein [Burkholderia contaminans]|uniref:Carbohydrate kinase family protein n=1 Tax=Burkholderia contaminans TaxID=488447 RepID=A0AAP4QZU7_9BURK|nr:MULTISPECIES: carbohydrate kinase family protein [Burkholderia]MBD1411634.1 carbohydrate kinase family protein [Burkholderia contaminans]MBH9669167.1 carbohydrate kinase family protein [Burkholderia contaminans]MBH9676151.1 carbohydrate kinase family protein [Burkholderia contaminans]MBH9706349.1 carbohydrate kinase family protein [Burkholderia contaminans]MBH9720895.1 carbohydrate kinase family protein [Burkholderia contaminans]